MSAPKGNEFWKLRLKHGRDYKIATAKEIEDNFEEYANWIEDNQLIEVDFRGKDATKVQLPKMRAMTKEHFALACGLSGWDYLEKYKERGEDFKEIITRIEKFIYYQKFSGAAAGFFNANIIARDLGLKDQSDVNLNDQRKVVGDMFPDELDDSQKKP